MTTIRTRFRVLPVLLAMTAVLATPLSADAATGPPDDFIVTHPDNGRTRLVAPLAEVELGNGDEIAFTTLVDGGGRAQGVMVTGVRSAGRAPLSSVDGLEGANPLELFVALARPGVEVPSELRDLYGGDVDPRRQGWARDLVLEAVPQGTSCPATDWQNQLTTYSGAFGNDPFTSTWDGPGTKPQHWSGGFGLGNGYVYHTLVGQADDVTAFYGSVLYCYGPVSHRFNGKYVGNQVSSRWRVAGTATWYAGESKQLTKVGDVFEHIWSPGNRFAPGAPTFDFQVRIYAAKPDDQFHIGATWVRGGPSDFKANG